MGFQIIVSAIPLNVKDKVLRDSNWVEGAADPVNEAPISGAEFGDWYIIWENTTNSIVSMQLTMAYGGASMKVVEGAGLAALSYSDEWQATNATITRAIEGGNAPPAVAAAVSRIDQEKYNDFELVTEVFAEITGFRYDHIHNGFRELTPITGWRKLLRGFLS